MRAVRVTSTAGPSALETTEIGEPEPAEDQVLIDVAAAGVNFPDLLLTQGRYQYRPDPPFVLGGEPAGTVRQAPPDSGFSPGDRVAAMSTVGAFAEVVAVAPETVFPLPDAVSFVAGACLPMNYLTMSFALRLRGGLQSGRCARARKSCSPPGDPANSHRAQIALGDDALRRHDNNGPPALLHQAPGREKAVTSANTAEFFGS